MSDKTTLEIANDIIQRCQNPKYPPQWKEAEALAAEVIRLSEENAGIMEEYQRYASNKSEALAEAENAMRADTEEELISSTLGWLAKYGTKK